uniref:Uncharacterized protein n=1 Tax=Rhodnius prolixus TaxID=13249 RepID=T1HJ99_RHOPR
MSVSDLDQDGHSHMSDDASSIASSQVAHKRTALNASPPNKKKKSRKVKSTKIREPSNKQTLPSSVDADSTPVGHDHLVLTSNGAQQPPCFITANPFAPLAINIDEENNIIEQEKEKSSKPPPIFIKNITNYVGMCRVLTSLVGDNNFSCKARASDTMVTRLHC